MGELLGMPEWLAAGIFVVAAAVLWLTFAHWRIGRAHKRVAARRPNPTKQEFLTSMADDCSAEAAQFVWDQSLVYIKPKLTPHPDDDLIMDLKIDDEDLTLDWPREWAEQRGFHETNFPDWPGEWLPTARNYARWLDLAPV